MEVGSLDWMPPWALAERQEPVTKSFDVFGLGKLLWAMLSGRPKLLLWYFERDDYNLMKLFPDQAEMGLVNELLRHCIVEHEDQCLDDASKLLERVDVLINHLSRGGYLDPTAKRRCRTCGKGTYQEYRDHPNNFGIEPTGMSSFKIFTCDHCGHVELFQLRSRDVPPPAWKKG